MKISFWEAMKLAIKSHLNGDYGTKGKFNAGLLQCEVVKEA